LAFAEREIVVRKWKLAFPSQSRVCILLTRRYEPVLGAGIWHITEKSMQPDLAFATEMTADWPTYSCNPELKQN